MSKIFYPFSRVLERFIHTQSASSIVLVVAAILAMLFANTTISSFYSQALQEKFFGLSVQHWINDGLMAIFFFVIGLEIKREIVVGELSSFRKAALPVFAAIGGMVVPAVINIWLNAGEDGNLSGWAIPMATDIAFALGVLTLFGNRIPVSLKVFLLALAIVDDLGAVIVIAVAYTSEIRVLGLGITFLGILSVMAMRYLRLKPYYFYIPTGAVVWFGVLYSGVHATLAGVLLGLLTPYRFPAERTSLQSFSPIDDLIHKLHPWVSFCIMPIFALANAGINVREMNLSGVYQSAPSVGVFLGLLLGKPIGIMTAVFLSTALGVASLPEALKRRHIFGVSLLAGIGFTMAIFITSLSLSSEHAESAKLAILAASICSALLGGIVLFFSLEKREVV